MVEDFKRWYILQVLAGYEKKVAQKIIEEVSSDVVEEVKVPTEHVIEIKKGKKINSEKKFFPGYIFVKMIFNDNILQTITKIQNVKGFLGGNKKPQPVREDEVKRVIDQENKSVISPKNTISFIVGEYVKIIDGPFESFNAVVEEVDEKNTRIKVSVSIFGRSTTIELEYGQVTKN